MGSLGLVTFISVIAEALAENLDDGELNVLGAALTQLGDTLTTIAVYRDFKSSNSDKQVTKQTTNEVQNAPKGGALK